MSTHKKSTIIHKGSDKPLADKNRHYVDNEKFYKALVERREQIEEAEKAGVSPPRVSEYIGECILHIAQGLIRHKSFSQHHLQQFHEDMMGDGIRNCIKYVDNFNVEKYDNPFGYFTQICSYAFIYRIGLEDKNKYTRYKATMRSITENTLAFVDENASVDDDFLGEGAVLTPEDYMADFIKRYEEKLDARKQKASKKKKKTGLLKNMKTEDDSDNE